MKQLFRYTLGLTLLLVAPIYIWWTVLTLTYTPGEELHPVNEWVVASAHGALAPVGRLFGYTEAARAVEGLYEDAPPVRPTSMSEAEIAAWLNESDLIRQMKQAHRAAIGTAIGACETDPLFWNDAWGFLADRHQAAALAGSPLTTCYRGDGTYVSTIRVDIRWHENVIFPIPVPPILVHEGLLHYAVTHSEDLAYYTRVYRHRHTN
jgi:hypothetical protein